MRRWVYAFTPRGSATFYARSYDPGLAYAGTAAAGAATGYGLVSIKHSLDSKLSQLNGEILQINTVDPGQSAGGEVVIDLPKSGDFPQLISLSVNWAGELHSFDFTVAEGQ